MSPNSDSEDEEYVPDIKLGSASSSDSDDEREQPDAKRARIDAEPEEDLERQQGKRKELWNAFRKSVASGSNTGTSTTAESETKTVKVEKRYMFAGREIKEIVEVALDSADAKKWPIVPPATSTSTDTDKDRGTFVSKSEIATESLTTVPAPSISTIASSSALTPLTKRGPRKPKVTLGAIPGSGSSSGSQPRNAPKKLTTLEKSAMDWRSHLSAADGDALKDELEANRKQNGGGYLEKVEFLERVNERRESLLDASKSGKRRRT